MNGHLSAIGTRIPVVFGYIAQSAVISLVLWVGLGGGQRNFRVPLQFSGDTAIYLAQIKTTVEDGWWWTNSRLSAPESFNALLFPSNSNVDQAVVRAVSLFFSDAGLVANLSWLTLVVLSGLSCTFVLRALRISLVSSLLCGTIFALAPYAIYRNLGHFSLVTFLVPFPCGLALLVARPASPWPSPRLLLLLIAACGLLGFNYVYYAFFGCFVILVGGLIGGLGARQPRALAVAVLAITLVAATTLINLAPSFAAWRAEGVPLIVRNKVPAESEVYGLKIRQLVSPVFEHSFPPFAAWTTAEGQAAFPLETENMVSRLGLMGSLGFLASIGVVLFAIGFRSETTTDDVVAAAGRLSIACVLLATIGGFGSLFALLVSPEIRGWNRITPFIMFFSLVPVGWAVDRARAPVLKMVLVALIATIALADQWWPIRSFASGRESIAAEYAALSDVVQRLEAQIPAGAMVLQLPFTIYLNDSGTEGMKPYDQLKPYLVSRQLRWSYPALSNRQFEWQQSAAGLPLEELVPAVRAEGFSAIWLDLHGYADGGAAAAAALEKAGGVPLLRDARYAAFGISNLPGGGNTVRRLTTLNKEALTNSLTKCTEAVVHAYDIVGKQSAPYPVPTVIDGETDIAVNGWVVLADGSRLARSVEVAIDGIPVKAVYGFERPDVAAYLKQPDAKNSGYRATIPAERLPMGSHNLTVRAVSPEGCYAETPVLQLMVR